MMDVAAFLFLRIILAWMFILPIKGLITDWPATVGLVKLIAPFKPVFFAVLMVIVMIVGSISVLLGLFAQVGAALLLVYSLIGFIVHYKLANQLSLLSLSTQASTEDKHILEVAKSLGEVGHITSAQKNIVIAASLFLIVMLGSGPYSLSTNLF